MFCDGEMYCVVTAVKITLAPGLSIYY